MSPLKETIEEEISLSLFPILSLYFSFEQFSLNFFSSPIFHCSRSRYLPLLVSLTPAFTLLPRGSHFHCLSLSLPLSRFLFLFFFLSTYSRSNSLSLPPPIPLSFIILSLSLSLIVAFSLYYSLSNFSLFSKAPFFLSSLTLFFTLRSLLNCSFLLQFLFLLRDLYSPSISFTF